MQQSLRQASIRAVTGTTGTYEEDWHSLFDIERITAGPFNQRLLAYINSRLGVTYTNINDAMAAMAAAESVDSFQAIGTFTPELWTPYSGAEVHFDFVNRRYFWNGLHRTESAFTTFTGASFGSGDATGLTGAGTAANHDITLNWSAVNISAPFVMAVVFRPALINGTQQQLVSIEAAATPAQNRTSQFIATTNAARHNTLVGNVSQVAQSSSALTVDTNYAIATLVQTNLFRNSLNGATAGAEDTSGTLPTFSLIRLLEAPSNNTPLTGAIRHVLFFQNTSGAEISQVDLNTLSGALALT
jgi:hypothetical protein